MEKKGNQTFVILNCENDYHCGCKLGRDILICQVRSWSPGQ